MAEICNRLDGIPLAIELAAARVRVLTAEQIADGLSDRFRLLTGGARTSLPRQQTLEASVDWSYRLLNDGERSILRRLSVFAGGFTLDAAEAVCSGPDISPYEVLDLLTGLVDKSLVTMDGARFGVLETIRMYGNRKLDDGDGEGVVARDRHLKYFLALAERAGPELDGSDMLGWLRILDADIANLRVALTWATSRRDADRGLRLTAALSRYWYLRTQREGRERLEAALHVDGASASLRANALCTLTFIAAGMVDVTSGRAFGTEAVSLAREIGDDRLLARALCWLGWALLTEPTAARPNIALSTWPFRQATT